MSAIYLTLASHRETDNEIRERVDRALVEFPDVVL
jgi:hypothetical protein